jgi:hypothetical protein
MAKVGSDRMGCKSPGLGWVTRVLHGFELGYPGFRGYFLIWMGLGRVLGGLAGRVKDELGFVRTGFISIFLKKKLDRNSLLVHELVGLHNK